MTERPSDHQQEPTTHQKLSFPTGTEPDLQAPTLDDGTKPVVLVLGGTGYVGGRLIPRLLNAGYRIKVLTRSRERTEAMPWSDQVEIHTGDASSVQDVAAACHDVDVLYYLLHSMSAGKNFADTDRTIAQAVSTAAADAGVGRIIYLGGLHPDGVELSDHLASRVEVGKILLDGPVPAIVLQAGVIIGSGSASFEMIRHLTEVLPVMPAPQWVRNHIQPIAVRDVLYYLLGAAGAQPVQNRAFDIGGPEALRYGELMHGYAHEAGLPPRHIRALPVLTPRLASYWVGLVTPVPQQIARPLVESLQHECVMKDHDIDAWITPPRAGLTPYREAVGLALSRIKLDAIETSWIDAQIATAPSRIKLDAIETSWIDAQIATAPSQPLPSDPDWAGRTVFTDERTFDTHASVPAVWKMISQVGGDRGWYSAPLLWSLRGFIDRAIGGVGLKRGRRSSSHIKVGDAIDVWRVETIVPEELLRLRAEMYVPGRAWLELGISHSKNGTQYWQRATFFPKGLSGHLYWYSMLPFHGMIFSTMAQRIISGAQELEQTS
ncbi:SDR family oxidoreductase [Micrococcoides hystricis]|uniref:SDR family oxidoreductase n=1 Tax=Micrococcoides hystricis TaxID=1572761 RepID=A0ABV6P7R4_9MICC